MSGRARVGWLDCSLGASGDMLLGALADAGADVAAPVAALGLGVRVRLEAVTRAGVAATRAQVDLPAGDPPPRHLADIEELLARVPLPAAVTGRCREVFRTLAAAEAAVHATSAAAVHFHEVGALDSIADVVGVVAGFADLDLDSVIASPPAVGSGTVAAGHGALPVPAPGVVELLRRHAIPTAPVPYADAGELLTPTAAALLACCADGFGPLPAMTVGRIGTGAGARDPQAAPNVTRLLVGEPAGAWSPGQPALLECTVDDADPRLWPAVLEALLTAGALDAWLTPVLMKKGRPGHVLTALVPPGAITAVRAAMFAETTTLGLREIGLRDRPALARTESAVDIAGQPVRIKLCDDGAGRIGQASVEWDDAAAAARALDLPVRVVLARAQAAASGWLGAPFPGSAGS